MQFYRLSDATFYDRINTRVFTYLFFCWLCSPNVCKSPSYVNRLFHYKYLKDPDPLCTVDSRYLDFAYLE